MDLWHAVLVCSCSRAGKHHHRLSDDEQPVYPALVCSRCRLYEKYGLDGKLVFIQGGSVLLQAMVAGQAQAAQNGIAETVTAILRGGDVRMLGVTAKIFPYS